MYYIYHIKGKKIGVTSNLLNRVTKQQGYALGEYEVLLSSDDIDYISEMEIELQKSYGYKVDRQKYKNLIKSNKMRINVTEQTTTFACPKDKLKGQLLDNEGFKWETSHGEFELTDKTIQWITDNSITSMYNDQRCYIYNKAFSVEFKKGPVKASICINYLKMLILIFNMKAKCLNYYLDLILIMNATKDNQMEKEIL
jgi:hypothetical protein